MRGFCVRGGLVLAAVCLLASVSSAATIQEVLAQAFDPSTTDFYAAGYGQSAYYLTWNKVDGGNLFDPTGAGGAAFTQTGATNPDWLDFKFAPDGGGGGGGGGTATSMRTTYTLGNNLGGAWTMDFSILFYDPSFTGTSLTVELLGSAAGSDFATKDVSMAEINAGMMVTWAIDAAIGENVTVRITSYDGETYAAGFFMDNASHAPEPASLGLLAVGAAGMALRRRRK
jgi:hypothetical protein